MISRLEGELVSVGDGRVEVAIGSLHYQLHIPACDEPDLATMTGHPVEFHTLHYLEAHGQGSSFVPKLIGFRSAEDRAFFELFTTVKGVGARKALRALRVPVTTVAEAIAGKDVAALVALPEIGRRTAETIVAELHGKVDRFVELKPVGAGADSAGSASRVALAADAIAVLVQLGENRLQARQLVDRALRKGDEIDTADALVAAALGMRDA